jgi:hypothetical protein
MGPMGKSRVATAKPFTNSRVQSGEVAQSHVINPGSNRILSANRSNRSANTRPLVPHSAKSSTGSIKSNLEPEFLNMFDNRI